MVTKAKHIFVDEQRAQSLQQVKDDDKIAGTTEILANGDNQKVSEEQKTKENNQKIEDDKIEVIISNKEKGKEKDKFETISIVKQRKVIESNVVKVGAAQCAVMAANALVGFSNPIGLMICVAIAFKKLTASTKNIEFKQDAGKVKGKTNNTDDKKNETNKIVIDIFDDDNKIEETIGKSNPVVLNIDKNNSEEINLKIDKKTLDEIGKLFSEEEQKKCAETSKVEISEDKAKKLSKILNCNVKAGTLDFNDEKSLNDVLEVRTVKNVEFMKALASILNPKISKNIQQIQQTSARRTTVEGRGATSLS